MKKFQFALLFFLLTSLLSYADNKCGANLTWSVSGTTLTVSGSGDMYNFSSSTTPWNSYKSTITSIVVKSGVTSIGSFAFQYFTSLTSLTIPNSVTFIGQQAFYQCSKLSTISLPSSIKAMENAVFDGTAWYNNQTSDQLLYLNTVAYKYKGWPSSTWKGVTIKSGTTVIAGSCFYGCTGLSSITIPSSVIYIGKYAFKNNTSLSSISIPSGVTAIHEETFSGCTSLSNITIPTTISDVEENVFYNTKWLANKSDGMVYINNVAYKYKGNIPENTTFRFQSSTTVITPRAFSDCTNAFSVVIPSTFTTIVDKLFYNCTGLKSVELPSTVTKIGSEVFCGCTNLQSINLPYNLTEIGYNAFSQCSALNTTLPSNLKTLGSGAFNGCSSITSINIPNTLKKIPSSAFCGTSIGALTIPSSVDSIETYAFSNCSKLKSIYFSNKIDSIVLGDQCFSKDTLNSIYVGRDLASKSTWSVFDGYYKIEFGKNVKKICPAMFYGYKGKTITIPKNITTIDNGAFSWGYNVPAKKLIFEDGNTPLTVGYNPRTIGSSSVKAGICYDMEIDSLYVGRDINWTEYESSYISSYGYFYGAPFEKMSHLKYVEYGDSVTNIAQYTFQGCDSLKVAKLGKSIKTMNNPFSNSGLDSLYVTMPACPSGTYPGYIYGKSVSNNQYQKKIITYVPSGTAADYRSRWNSQCIIMDDSEDIVYAILSKPGTLASKIIAKGLQTKNVAKLKINGELNDTDWELLKYSNMPYLTYLDLSEVTNDSIPSQLYGSTSIYSFNNTLNTLILPENLKRIGDYAFSGCVSLGNDLTLPQSLKRVGNCAMRYTNYTSLSIPSEDCAIDSCAFNGCTKLKSVEIGNGSVLGTNAFYNCTSLNEVSVGKNSIIGTSAFKADPINSLSLNEGTTIGKYAFQNCNKITSLIIPGNETKVGDYSFYGLGYLEGLTIQEGVSSIGNYAFYSSYNSPAFKGELIIPSSVKSIGNYAFYGWKNMTKLTFGDDAESIGDYAFYGCANIDSLYLPRELKTLGNYAFCGATRLKYVDVPAKIESFGQNYGSFSSCDSISVVKSHAETPVDILASSFTSNVYKEATLYVPEDAAGNYLIATGWKEFTNISAIPAVKATSISLDKETVSLKAGETAQLTATVLPEDATDKTVTWKSSDTNIATVSDAGLVTTLAEGTATITATTTDGTNFSANCVVTVTMSEGDDPTQYTTVLYGADSEGCANGTFALPIELKSDFTVKAFEFDVTLPDGMSFITGNSGYQCTRTSRVSDGYTITCNTISGQSTNTAHVICSNTSNPNDVISGNSGTILYISVAIASTVTKGDYNIGVSGITLVKTDDSEYSDLNAKKFNAKVSVIEYILGDANNSGKVNVADITAVVSHIYGETPDVFNKAAADVNGNGLINVADITGIVSIIYGGSSSAKGISAQKQEKSSITIPTVSAKAGDEIQLPIYMSNAGNTSSFQFDLALPENVKATGVNQMSDLYVATGGYVDDKYRVMCYSSTNATFMDSPSPVAYITLTVDKSLLAGIYDMNLSSAITSKSGEEQSPTLNCGKLSIGSVTGINNVNANVDADNKTIYDLTGCRLQKTQNGINIINGKKQIIIK